MVQWLNYHSLRDQLKDPFDMLKLPFASFGHFFLTSFLGAEGELTRQAATEDARFGIGVVSLVVSSFPNKICGRGCDVPL